MAKIINIGSDDIVKFTNRLEKMRRSDLPVVVRQTLNKAAFDMRNKSMPEEYKKDFTVRDKNFLRSRSRVKPVQGFTISEMKATTGIFGSDPNTKGLAKQTTGGNVPGRSFIPREEARTSRSIQKKVRRNARLKNIRLNRRVKKGNKKGFIKSAWKAGVGGFVLYGNTLHEIRSLRRTRRGIRTRMIYSFDKGRSAKITEKKTYIQRAANTQGRLMNRNFGSLANKRINRNKL